MGDIQLKQHQKLPVAFIRDNHGLILFHSPGSGKTITALVSMKQFVDKDNKDVIVIGPKSSKKAFGDEIRKLGYDAEKFQLYTYQKIKKVVHDNIDFFRGKCVILDEAHHLRNETRDNMFLISVLSTAYKIMLLTATPIVNYLNDVAPLVNLAKNADVLPTDKDLFNFLYFDEDKLQIRNRGTLMEKLKGAISYYEKKDDGDYPTVGTVVTEVEMTVEQVDAYSEYIRRFLYDDYVPPNIDLFLVDFEFLSKKRLNSFLSATRQISNTYNGDPKSFKLQAILKVVEKGPFPAIIYSNYLDNGVYTMATLLTKAGISYKLISGSTGDDKIIKIVNEYNSRLFNVLLITSAGSESLDLKGTRQIHVMEPHWNESKIDQVIGRGIRYQSHSELHISDRNVTVYYWVSVFPKPYTNLSADQYLIEISKRKREVLDAFRGIIIDASIEKSGLPITGGYYRHKYTVYRDRYMAMKMERR